VPHANKPCRCAESAFSFFSLGHWGRRGGCSPHWLRYFSYVCAWPCARVGQAINLTRHANGSSPFQNLRIGYAAYQLYCWALSCADGLR